MIRSRTPRRIGAALVAAGLTVGGAAFAAWQAGPANAADPGGGLESFELHAGGRGVNFYSAPGSGGGLDDPGAAIAETEANLANGPVGSGVAATAWPGPTAANGGTLLLVLQPGCSVTQGQNVPGACPIPNEVATNANLPAKAEAHTGSKVPSASSDPTPNIHLTAAALDNDTIGDAVVNQIGGAVGNIGKIVTHAESTSSSDGGKAVGTSNITDIDIGGVVKIKSISSNAQATTDGNAATGKADTVVNGMTIAGQPATIDKDGLHIGGGGGPSPVSQQIAQQALQQAGITMTLGTGESHIQGSSATVTAPPLIIMFGKASDNSGPNAVIFGGSTASVKGSRQSSDLSSSVSDLTGGSSIGGSSDLGGTGSIGDIGGTGSPSAVTPSRAGGSSGGQQLGVTAPIASHGTPIGTGPIILAVIGAGLLAIGARRLSDDVLSEQVGTTCPLDEV